MKIDFVLVNPGGNVTALVLSKVGTDLFFPISKNILKEFSECEQVGFIKPAKGANAVCGLQMAGGEFCGNALRSLAFYLGQEQDGNFVVESSGLQLPIRVFKRGCLVGVDVPISQAAKRTLVQIGSAPAIKVEMEGITHFLIDQDFFNPCISFLEVFKKLYKQKIVDTEACGLVYFKKFKENYFKIYSLNSEL